MTEWMNEWAYVSNANETLVIASISNKEQCYSIVPVITMH